MSSIVCPTCRTANEAGVPYCRMCAAPLGGGAPLGAGNTIVTGTPRIAGHVWIVGSGPECDIVVARPTVSRRHCRLMEMGGVFQIEDLGSRNGTYVNGTRIETP